MKRKDNARGFIRLFSLECLVIALIIFPLLHTHAAPHQANEREEAVQEIVESRDSAVILFGRAQNMFALLFDDSQVYHFASLATVSANPLITLATAEISSSGIIISVFW